MYLVPLLLPLVFVMVPDYWMTPDEHKSNRHVKVVKRQIVTDRAPGGG